MLRRLSLLLLVLASLVCANLASAKTLGAAKTRVWAIDVVGGVLVGRAGEPSARWQPENPAAYYGTASGNTLAAEGISLSAARAGASELETLVSDLTSAQSSNLARFVNKLPAAAEETIVRELPNGGVAFQSAVPGRVPGSFAVYEKQVDALGSTLQFTKTTYGPSGAMIHVKDKLTGGVFFP